MTREHLRRCPLCGGRGWFEVRTLPTAPISSYWSRIGVYLDTEYSPWPLEFSQHQCVHCGVHSYSPMVVGKPFLYASLAAQNWYYPGVKWEFIDVLQFLSGRGIGKLLEFGCGRGRFLSAARHVIPTAVGVEFNPDAVIACLGQGLDVREELPEDGDGQFDCVTAFQVLEHLADPQTVLDRLINLIAPGGWLVLSVPNQDGPLADLRLNFLNQPPHHVTLWPRTALEWVAQRFHLEFAAYRREPLSHQLFATWVSERSEQLCSDLTGLRRVGRAPLRIAFRTFAALAFPFAGDRLSGHTHVAYLRKS